MKTASFFSVGLVWALLLPLTSAVQAVETIGLGRYRFNVLAGAPGTTGYVDGVGAAARFDKPSGIAVDASGNVYVSERVLCTVRKISPDGVVTTLAGMPGQPGSQDGTGSMARFKNPLRVAVDGAGNVYVADAGNFTIRKISAAGAVTTLAGTAGVAGSRDGAAAEALFESPHYIAADHAGNVFVTETYPHSRIRKITPDGMVSTLKLTLPGDYAGSIEVWADDLRVDHAGNLYVIHFDGWDFVSVAMFRRISEGQYEPGLVLRPPAPLSSWNQVNCIALDDADILYVKFGTDPVCRFTPRGEVDVRYAFGSSGGYLWTGLAVDQRGRLLTLPYSYFDKVGAIEVGAYDPAATGLVILQQPFDNEVEIGNPWATTLGVRAAGALAFTYQWLFNSNPISGATNAYLRLDNLQAGHAGSYLVVAADRTSGETVASRSAKFEISKYRRVALGDSVTLTVPASGTPEPAIQWRKTDQPISGATRAMLTLSSVQATDAGTYTAVATHAGTANYSDGSVAALPFRYLTSTAFTVIVTPTGPPVIMRQPVPVTVARGSTAVFNVSATGATTYQWNHFGVPILGATNATLVIRHAKTTDAVSYSVSIRNSGGATLSTVASLGLSDDANFGHLTNLSVRARITADDPSFTVGTVIGGGTGGTKSLLVRAVGPSLAALGVATPIPDSKLEIRAGGVVLAENNDWGGDEALRNAAVAVGAFPFAADSSKDAAVFNSNFAARDYTIDVSGVGGTAGDVIAELYDTSATFSASTPRLMNLSVLKRVNSGDRLIAGFVIGGTTARTVLVRAIGPGLAAPNVAGMPDPQLSLFNATQTRIAENDNWDGDPQFAGVGADVGAFGISDRGSKDAMLLITLPPGSYTAQVSDMGGGGSVLIEVYEVP